MSARPFTPAYNVGDIVRYVDHHDRLQTGEVCGIEAHWWRGKDEPFATYDIHHPTYRNNRIYAGFDRIKGLFKAGV